MIKLTLCITVKRIIIFVALVLFYIAVWNVVVNYPVTPFVLNSVNGGDNIAISDSVSVVVMRYNVLPVYWSEIGKLTMIHDIFALLVTLACFITFNKKKNLLGHAIAISKLEGGESE